MFGIVGIFMLKKAGMSLGCMSSSVFVEFGISMRNVSGIFDVDCIGWGGEGLSASNLGIVRVFMLEKVGLFRFSMRDVSEVFDVGCIV